MKVCTNCQWQCEDNDTYCPNCGGNQFYLMQNYIADDNPQYNYAQQENNNSQYNYTQGENYNSQYNYTQDDNNSQYNDFQRETDDSQFKNEFYQSNNAESDWNLNQNNNLNYQQNNKAFQQNTYANNAPAITLNSSRGMIVFILLSLITLGIYGIVTYSSISSEINIVASRYDGRKTNHFLAQNILSILTGGIYFFVWWHGISERIGNELKRRKIDYKFGAKDFWLWNILGTLIIVGPFVYLYKLLKSMNYINENYNLYG